MSEKAENINFDKKSPEELNKLEAEIQSSRIKKHLNEEEQRIKDICCPECGSNLKLKPKDFMIIDRRPAQIECKECERLVKVSVKYLESPETSDATINIRKGGYAWVSQPPASWKDKHAERYYEDEKEKLLAGTSSLSLEGQKLLRVMMLIKK